MNTDKCEPARVGDIFRSSFATVIVLVTYRAYESKHEIYGMEIKLFIFIFNLIFCLFVTVNDLYIIAMAERWAKKSIFRNAALESKN